uniref:Uncharacterized protein n=1 Tax=Strombidium inclinatum TaxID=197538 RepID=A0A7S3MXJ7_9SPIT|mmetsp:Transcript_18384/g.28208  ORF Transcript_18384/g.28208 Transcript_18384/m.28208 type:complete len:114 (+) Transcript_18384:731-1072(+)
MFSPMPAKNLDYLRQTRRDALKKAQAEKLNGSLLSAAPLDKTSQRLKSRAGYEMTTMFGSFKVPKETQSRFGSVHENPNRRENSILATLKVDKWRKGEHEDLKQLIMSNKARV